MSEIKERCENCIAAFEKVSFEQFKKDLLKTPIARGMSDDQIRSVYDGIALPTRATKGSAGYDFHSPIGFELYPNGWITFPTGIRCKMNSGWVLMCVPRSGSGFKYGIRLMNTVGVIDSDYYSAENEGHIHVKLHNTSPEENVWRVKRGDGIMQGIFLPFGTVENESVTKERVGGFGSTGN